MGLQESRGVGVIDKFKYSDKELNEIIKSMVVLVDRREHEGVNQHILDYFDKKGISYKSKSLKYGDYSFYLPKNEELGIVRDMYFDKDIVIERKNSLEELSQNFTTERDRLEKEFALAPKHKVLLIENATYGDVVMGNYKTQYNEKSYWASLHSMWHRYDIPVIFMPDKKFTGCFMRGYFTYYLREYLR